MRFGIPNTARQLLKTDEYEWLVSYLTSRGLLRWSRWLVAIDGATIGVTAMLAALAPPGVLWPYGNLVMVGLAVAGICWSARWLLGRWPSHLESLVLIAAADIGVATACFAHHNLVLGVAATPLFAATGAYIAFFHSTAANICHIVFAVTVVVTAVVASAFVQGPQWLPVAMSKGLIALLLTALVLPFLRIAYSMFRSSADASAVDSLTGLLNRRGLRQEVAKAEIESPDSPPWTVVAVDLDNFKAVNDIYGHQRGDDVLVAVADLLRRCQVPGTHTLIVRLGGDEFAMACARQRPMQSASPPASCTRSARKRISACRRASASPRAIPTATCSNWSRRRTRRCTPRNDQAATRRLGSRSGRVRTPTLTTRTTGSRAVKARACSRVPGPSRGASGWPGRARSSSEAA